MTGTGNDPERDAAETVGLQGLVFLLSEPRHLERFLADTGITADELAANAQETHVLEAVLNQLMANEALLLAFAANAGLAPEEVARAHDHLSTGGGRQRPHVST
jgi:hypothetical protein